MEQGKKGGKKDKTSTLYTGKKMYTTQISMPGGRQQKVPLMHIMAHCFLPGFELDEATLQPVNGGVIVKQVQVGPNHSVANLRVVTE
jgi:hypothetical protein